MRPAIYLLVAMTLANCVEKKKDPSAATVDNGNLIQYAVGFKVTPVQNSKLLEVTYPFQGATSGYHYLLVPRGESVPGHAPDTRVIFTPVRSIVCTSTTHIPLLDYLGETGKLTGFPTTDYISSEKMRKRID